MKSLELPPAPPLRPYVQLIWCFELDAPVDFGPPERIAPDGIVELVFHYRDPMALRFAGQDFARQPTSFAVFQTRRFLEIRPAGSTGFLSVRLRPWGACHFLRAPLSEFADQVVPSRELWGSAAAELEERLATAANSRQRVRLVEQFLLDRLHHHHKADIEPLVRTVWNRAGETRVAALCRELGLGERTMERLFADNLGMSPKSLARLTRFLRACSALRKGGFATLTEVGHGCGYYDQAHFINDFRKFSGLTPKQFLETQAFSFLELD